MEAYLAIAKGLADKFSKFTLTRIPRGENTSADALAALASTSDPDMRRVIPVEFIEHPSILAADNVALVGRRRVFANEPAEDMEVDPPEADQVEAEQAEVPVEEPNMENDEYGCDKKWMSPILLFLNDAELPADKWEARKLKAIAARYFHMDGNLFRWGMTGPYLTCVEGAEARQVMQRVHGGSCGNHSGGRSLAIRIKRHGFFWPTMVKDCEKFSKKCEKCQRHAPSIHQPTELLNSISSPYPFMRWGMDIVGPLHRSKQKQFLLIMTDYFSKWVEAEAYASIKDAQVERFVWRNILCRHGVPYEIVTDNGSQFISARFESFCEKWKIRLSKSTPRYPQGNGQAEATNKTIIDGLKKRLDEKKGLWAEELEGVLWSHRTTPRRPTGETPFSLVYGMECVIPVEVDFPGVRRRLLPGQEGLNHMLLMDHLDLINERRDQALIRLQSYQSAAARYYNTNIKERKFYEGDLVLRKVFQNTAETNAGKLGVKWEGPYRITKVVRPGVYKLVNMSGVPIPRSWNSLHLKKYYH